MSRKITPEPTLEAPEREGCEEADILFEAIDSYREMLNKIIRSNMFNAASFFEQGYLAGLLMAREILHDYVNVKTTGHED